MREESTVWSTIIGEEGLLKQLAKALIERTLNAEMTDHLGHSKYAPVANHDGNTRNGKGRKTLKGDFGEFPIEVPPDRPRDSSPPDGHVCDGSFPTLISTVTYAVIEGVKAWQSRTLEALYPLVYLDCFHVKVRDSGTVKVKAVYLALGVNLQGEEGLLGL